MSDKNFKAIFEKKTPPLDQFIGGTGAWGKVCAEFGSLEPIGILTQRGEIVDTSQVQGFSKSVFKCIWSPTTFAITTDCRMKIARPVKVNEQEDDANFRIFNLESIVNVREQNRELQMLVVERV